MQEYKINLKLPQGNSVTEIIPEGITFEALASKYQNLYKDNFTAHVSESITVNEDTLELKYSYTGNQAKMLVDNRAYEAELSPEDFIAHFAPAVLLDSTLYKTTEASQSDGITMFTFSDAWRSSCLSNINFICFSVCYFINSCHCLLI
jgi:hypothetical protein